MALRQAPQELGKIQGTPGHQHERFSVHSYAGWSEHRVQEYFEWAAQVVKGLQGTNRQLEESLRQLFKERGLTL